MGRWRQRDQLQLSTQVNNTSPATPPPPHSPAKLPLKSRLTPRMFQWCVCWVCVMCVCACVRECVVCVMCVCVRGCVVCVCSVVCLCVCSLWLKWVITFWHFMEKKSRRTQWLMVGHNIGVRMFTTSACLTCTATLGSPAVSAHTYSWCTQVSPPTRQYFALCSVSTHTRFTSSALLPYVAVRWSSASYH